MSKRTLSTIAGCGILIVVAALAILFIHPIRRYDEARCRGQLKSLGYVIEVYQRDHGHLPDKLCTLSNDLVDPALLVCPGSGHAAGNFTNAEAWTDYIFINWPVVRGTNAVPAGFPVAYDRHLSNHSGRGVNVLTVDGLVRWDTRAEWLKEFAAEHPDAKLPLPK